MNIRRFIVFGHDVVVAALAWLVAFWLRFNLDVPADYATAMVSRLPPIASASSAGAIR